MKNHVSLTPLAVSYQYEHGPRSFPLSGNRRDCARSRQQRRLLLGVSILVILCWTIGAIFLIGTRREERSPAEMLAQQGVIAALFPEEMEGSR
jgi:hypothetical protein